MQGTVPWRCVGTGAYWSVDALVKPGGSALGVRLRCPWKALLPRSGSELEEEVATGGRGSAQAQLIPAGPVRLTLGYPRQVSLRVALGTWVSGFLQAQGRASIVVLHGQCQDWGVLRRAPRGDAREEKREMG